MIIPTFEEKTIPILYMESHINEEPSEEAKQFKRILKTVKDFERLPNVSEMTAILKYQDQALTYAYELAINTLTKRGFERDLTDIYNAVNDEKFYSKALKNDITFAKYCTLQKVLNELLIIGSIQQEVRELNFLMNNTDTELINSIKDLKHE